MSKRISILQQHLDPNLLRANPSPPQETLQNSIINIHEQILSEEYLGRSQVIIKSFRDQFKSSTLHNHPMLLFLNKQDKYLRILNQTIDFLSKSHIDYKTDMKDPIYKMDILQVVSEFDMATGARFGVHLGLYVDTLQNVGSKKHENLRDMGYSLKHYGCFALTELGHGSNVSSIETTAHFDTSTREFIFNSPTMTSAKWWIGALAKTANMAVVWAQLYIANECKGVHAFVLEIRDYETHEVKPGIVIGDCGEKIELEGVDNGFLLFSNFRADYDCLLDYYSQITPEGKFKSTIKNNEKRVGIMLGSLLRGRIVVVQTSEIVLRNALTIAIRFRYARKQYALTNQHVGYGDNLHNLIPQLSRLFAIRASVLYIYSLYSLVYPTVRENHDSEDLAEFHAILSGLKNIASRYSITGVQESKVCCGEIGNSMHAGLTRLRNTCDVLLTWEGDNTILLQQTGKYILKHIQKGFKGVESESKTLKFLKISGEQRPWPIKKQDDICAENFIVFL